MLSFDGIANSVQTGASVINTSKSFTVAAWLNPAQASSTYVATALAQHGVNEEMFFLQNSLDRWRLCVPNSDATTFAGTCASTPAGSVLTNQWTFVAGVWNADNHQLLLYTASSPTSLSTPVVASQTQAVPASTGTLAIGRDVIGSTARYWNGGICDPIVVQGVADRRQLGQLASLTAPNALTPPV